jgi:hypothetical protein
MKKMAINIKRYINQVVSVSFEHQPNFLIVGKLNYISESQKFFISIQGANIFFIEPEIESVVNKRRDVFIKLKPAYTQERVKPISEGSSIKIIEVFEKYVTKTGIKTYGQPDSVAEITSDKKRFYLVPEEKNSAEGTLDVVLYEKESDFWKEYSPGPII